MPIAINHDQIGGAIVMVAVVGHIVIENRRQAERAGAGTAATPGGECG